MYVYVYVYVYVYNMYRYFLVYVLLSIILILESFKGRQISSHGLMAIHTVKQSPVLTTAQIIYMCLRKKYVYDLVKTLDNSEFPSNIQWGINGKHDALRLGLRGCHFSDRQYLR